MDDKTDKAKFHSLRGVGTSPQLSQTTLKETHLAIAVKEPIHTDLNLIKQMMIQSWIKLTPNHLLHRISYLRS